MRSWLLQLALCSLLAHIHGSDAATTHTRRAPVCGKNKFQCKNGACIDSRVVCDGVQDCADSSDAATTHTRRAPVCGKNKFQCKNGACIDSRVVCDGVQDCADSSDEGHYPCYNWWVTEVANFILNDVLQPSVTCPEGKYQCPTGKECIDSKLKCNGKSDCSDGADERLPECPPSCKADEFRCKTGSCVPSSSVCNRKPDCSDGSDEALCDNGPDGVRPCLYPPNIENGKYIVDGCESCTPVPGKPVQDGQDVLRYTCDPGYALKGEYIIFCRNGKWNVDTPSCEQIKCQRLSSDSVQADCTYNQFKFTCDRTVLPGTKAVVTCQTYYTSSIPKQSLTCGINGKWNYEVMRCYPECGKNQYGDNTFIINGEGVNKGQFPWHVAIYKYDENIYKNICGGSLISLKYVLSAAHCFWNPARRVAFDGNLFKVIAGKYYSNYATKEDGQQERAVIFIDIPPSYTGGDTYYRDDIAVLTVDKPFELRETIRPVCVDWENLYIVVPGDKGQVAGWGKTETKQASEVLLSAEFPVIEYIQCQRHTKPIFRNYFGREKICAGYGNESTVCYGDSGGGLTFIHELNPTGVASYFVQGIVSSGGGPGCNPKDYVAFTKVERYLDFLAKYREY